MQLRVVIYRRIIAIEKTLHLFRKGQHIVFTANIPTVAQRAEERDSRELVRYAVALGTPC